MRKLKQTYPLTVDPSFPPLTVEGVYFEAYPALAVHKYSDGYFVDHIASGLYLGCFSRQRDALWFMEQVADLVDWSLEKDALLEVLRPHPEITSYIYNLIFWGQGQTFEKPEPLIPPAPSRLSLF